MEQVAPRLTEAAPSRLGARLVGTGVEFAVFSRHAEMIDVCVFDEMGEREIARWRLGARDEDIHHGFVPEIGPGARYGLRADGPYDRARGHCFDPAKLLVDPFARRIDRPFAWRPELAAPRASGIDTAPFMPRAIIEQPTAPRRQCSSGGRPSLIYEIGVRAFTRMNPDVPGELRGTLEGLASPRVLDYLVRLGVSH